ncbi:MAG: hypothetical protein IBJ18_05135 [Phycisphaerales bacterium]|nr:hypothetical protein [Phycisphaerales bacterium]
MADLFPADSAGNVNRTNRSLLSGLGRASTVALCTAIGLSLSACAPTPKIDVVSATVTDASDEAVVVSFVLTASNTYEEGLPLQDITYTATVGSQSVRMVRSPEATLRAAGQQSFVVPAALTIPRSARESLKQVPWTLSATARYTEPGAIPRTLYDWGVRQPSASASGSGTIDLSAAPKPAVVPESVSGQRRANAGNSSTSNVDTTKP